MADTFTTLLKLVKPDIGGDNNTWGDLYHDAMDALDAVYRDAGGDLLTGGSANSYTASPAWTDIAALADGVHIRVRIHAANTGSSTLNYDALGSIIIKKKVRGGATALAQGDLPIGHYADLIYSETDVAWILMNPGVSDVLLLHDWVDVASAPTTNLDAAGSPLVNVTGTTTITGFGTVQSGYIVFVKFAAALTLTHDPVSLILIGGENITTAADQVFVFKSEGSGNYRMLLGPGGGVSGGNATAAEIWAGTTTKAVGVDQMQAALAEVTLTDGATVTVDFATGINFKLDTIAGNRTLAFATIPAAVVGRSGYIRVKQDGTGSRTLDMSSATILNVNGTNLVLSTVANAVDIIPYTILSTTQVLMSMARGIA